MAIRKLIEQVEKRYLGMPEDRRRQLLREAIGKNRTVLDLIGAHAPEMFEDFLADALDEFLKPEASTQG